MHSFAGTTTYLTANHPPPQYSYVYNPKGEKEVGEQAQHLPDILGYQKDQKNTVFFDKLNDLLKKHLKITIEVETFRNNTLIIEIIDENGVKNILPDVGAGIVQVLPVFVQSVLADQQSAFSTIIIEEPESNLNPYAQAELADVFIASAKLHSNNRFLLETHSETLVLRLQRRILEGKISPSDVAIYFVERKKEGIGSEIKRVQWDEDAQTFDFPEEFFDADYIEARAITKLQTPKKITDLAW
ncbi:MAG: AAA family ATPase [Sphingobacteriales bacterium]|nr:AAA family ATPase [Sphingobacteriales bacterium]